LRCASRRLRLGLILRCESDRCMHCADVDLAGRLGNKPPSYQIRCVYAEDWRRRGMLLLPSRLVRR
jgi:hypothetical protein